MNMKLNVFKNLKLYKLAREIKVFFHDVAIENKEVKYQKILFCPINASQINTIREGLIAKKCQLKGAEVSLLFQRHKLKSSLYYNSFMKYQLYRFKIGINVSFLRTLGLKSFFALKPDLKIDSDKMFTEAIKNKVDFHKYEYKEILIGDFILADTIREQLCPEPLWEDPDFISLLNRKFVTAIELFESYDSTLNSLKPDKLVMSHGIYSIWGILFRIARSKNIPVDVYNGSYRKNTLRFYHNTPNAPMPMKDWDEQYCDLPLTSGQLDLVDRYLETRDTQSEDNISLFDDSKIDNEDLNLFLDVAKSQKAKLCCLFSNIGWDAYAFAGNNSFETMSSWIFSNIDFFIKNPSHFLIIKCHPAEEYFKVPNQYRVKSIIQSKYDKLPSNIFILDEYSSVKPFDLYEFLDIGLVHISTVAMEMALKDKIVLNSGEGSQYSSKGFTIDPKSEKEYFQKLQGLLDETISFVPDKLMAKKYLFFRFFREAIPMNLMSIEDIYSFENLSFNSLNSFMNERYSNFISEGIIDDGPFILPDHLISMDH